MSRNNVAIQVQKAISEGDSINIKSTKSTFMNPDDERAKTVKAEVIKFYPNFVQTRHSGIQESFAYIDVYKAIKEQPVDRPIERKRKRGAYAAKTRN